MQGKRIFTLLALPSVGNFHSCFNLWCTDKLSTWARLYVWGRDRGGKLILLFLGVGIKEKVMGVVYGLKHLKWHSFLNIGLQTCLGLGWAWQYWDLVSLNATEGFLGKSWEHFGDVRATLVMWEPYFVIKYFRLLKSHSKGFVFKICLWTSVFSCVGSLLCVNYPEWVAL